ncbi:hypothetical protein EHS13_27690 [Paenibacillus psychroresistens]|uniref:Uncharacterized protein n=1 Tax=Paenibacillus psychroresistens TaxID=1778678 RepID=A0A6B8RPV0_9BACL|nr:hypothetical protein [Paenibacillus psychroresistens]QGQ98401.1 hypothetical protein EHS13_27690 [Paenibacillus psychroresistens]
MSNDVFWLSLIGLAIAILGSLFLYLGTPMDIGIHKPASGMIVRITNEDRMAADNVIRRREQLSKLGFIFLLIGFVAQLVSVLLQAP